MNAKTKAFLDDLVNLCLAHGVFVDSSPVEGANDTVVGTVHEFRSDYNRPAGQNSIALTPEEIRSAIDDARKKAKQPMPPTLAETLNQKSRFAGDRAWLNLIHIALDDLLNRGERERAIELFELLDDALKLR